MTATLPSPTRHQDGRASHPRPSAGFARTWLLRSALLAEEVHDGADVLVLDLEDGLPAGRKAEGRHRAAARLAEDGTVWLRINPAGTPDWADDLALVAAAPAVGGVMLAMCSDADDVERTVRRLPDGIPVIAMIETAAALLRAPDIAAHPSVVRLAFGSGDFRRDTGMSADPLALSWPRAQLVVASAAAGKSGPIDGPSLGGTEEARAATTNAALVGMTGALVLDPGQLSVVAAGFSPQPAEIAAAEATVAHASSGAVDGSYAPALARARRVLERADVFGLR